MPDSFEKWGIATGSAVINNRFGKATDNYLSGSGFGEAIIREYIKLGAGANSNSIPQEIK